MWLMNKGCSCSLFESEGQLKLQTLRTIPSLRGKGYARNLLLIAKKIAKRKGKPIELFVGPFDDRPMDKDQLEKFYNSCGFKFSRMDYGVMFLIYNPKGE